MTETLVIKGIRRRGKERPPNAIEPQLPFHIRPSAFRINIDGRLAAAKPPISCRNEQPLGWLV